MGHGRCHRRRPPRGGEDARDRRLTRRFPDGFLWGASTSAFQIEGGIEEDGRGPSIWDVFCDTPARVRGGDHARVAADHRHRMEDDVRLLADLGLPSYRFSVAWPRVQPAGSGAVSQRGLDFYRRLVDELLAHDVEPLLTLYHWDLPQALEEGGGWPARETAQRFADYAGVVAGALGDRVTRWGTVNEPFCIAMLGYAGGQHAPGRQEPGAAVAAAHHVLLAHGLAVDVLRTQVPGAEVSITLNPYPVVPAGDRDDDRDAARRVDGIANRIWYGPLLDGAYPDDVLEDVSPVSDLRHIRDGDLETISRPVDALGLNYYRRHHVRFSPGASVAAEWPGSTDLETVTPPGPVTDGGWAIEPAGLTEVLLRLRDDHPRHPPLYVHENGAAFHERRQDDRRIAYLEAHLHAALDAVDRGVDLRGYVVWSLLDNFEWAEGYAHRFGIVDVDFRTLARTPKASARWFADVVRANALPGDRPAEL